MGGYGSGGSRNAGRKRMQVTTNFGVFDCRDWTRRQLAELAEAMEKSRARVLAQLIDEAHRRVFAERT